MLRNRTSKEKYTPQIDRHHPIVLFWSDCPKIDALCVNSCRLDKNVDIAKGILCLRNNLIGGFSIRHIHNNECNTIRMTELFHTSP